jgi:hypothetical protein
VLSQSLSVHPGNEEPSNGVFPLAPRW